MSADARKAAAASSEEPAYVVAHCHAETVDRLSPSFARITLAGRDLHVIGNPGRIFDQRIKLIFPSAGHPLPDLQGTDWYAQWLDLPASQRGSMRTYSIRELLVDAGSTRVVVDFVLHSHHGDAGPASDWATSAQQGDEVLMIGPRRGRDDTAGLEFLPGDAQQILLAGDETAAPAIARILEDCPSHLTGSAYIEVPEPEDEVPIAAPSGVHLTWLPRSGAEWGGRLIPTVTGQLGGRQRTTAVAGLMHEAREDAELLWETPRFSSQGDPLPAQPVIAEPSRCFYWIAGESTVITTLRRHLVKDLGVDRTQVAFMGYWKRGVAMRG